MIRNAEKGFTLVEVVIVAALTSIVALGIFTLFGMYTETSRETSAYLKMQRQSETLMDEIGRRVREAYLILAAGEDFADIETRLATVWNLEEDPLANPVMEAPNADEFILVDHNGTVMGSFRTVNADGATVMQQCRDAVCDIFSIDGTPLELEPSANNPFRLLENRRQVRVNVTLRMPTLREEVRTLTVEEGVFQCRL